MNIYKLLLPCYQVINKRPTGPLFIIDFLKLVVDPDQLALGKPSDKIPHSFQYT